MKSLVESINSSSINESATTLALLSSVIMLNMVVHAAAGRDTTSSSYYDNRSFFQVIKDDITGFFKDKKINKIADRLREDPEVMEYVNDPRKKGWRKMLETKLDDEEMKYLNSITRTYFQ